jgi:hypothetical protein
MFGTSLHHNGCYRIDLQTVCLFSAVLQQWASKRQSFGIGAGSASLELAAPVPNVL